MQNDLKKIKEIMGDNAPLKSLQVNQYQPDEKISAIYNWKRASSVSFDTSFVDSLYDQYLQRGKLSDKQVAALDKIITKFNICLDTWG